MPESGALPRQHYEHGHSNKTSRSRSHRKVHRWSRRSRLLGAALALSLLIIFFLILFFGIKVYSLNQENEALLVQVRQNEQELVPLRTEVVQLRQEVEALVQDRLPHLEPLIYDEVIPLNEGYAKHIAFTLVKKGDEQKHEYKLVLQNDSLSTVEPLIEVYLFDRRGIQVGVSKIEGDVSMGLGEVRSYTRTIVTERGETPAYFMVRLREEAPPILYEEYEEE